MADEYPCPDCDFVAKSRFGLVGHSNKHKAERRRSDDKLSEPAGQSGEAPPEPAAEEAPRPRRPGVFERVRSWGRGRGGPASSAPGRERPPKRTRRVGRRVALDADISDVWAALGRRLESTDHYPTGRMLQYQALGAGVIIDKAVAGTLPDRVLLQPLARQKDRWSDVGLIVFPPLLTFAMTQTQLEMQAARADQDPDRYRAAEQRLAFQKEAFEWMARPMLLRLSEGIAKARERQAKEEAVITEAFPELAGTGIDPLQALGSMLFAPRPEGAPYERNGHDPSEPAPGSSPAGTPGAVA